MILRNFNFSTKSFNNFNFNFSPKSFNNFIFKVYCLLPVNKYYIYHSYDKDNIYLFLKFKITFKKN